MDRTEPAGQVFAKHRKGTSVLSNNESLDVKEGKPVEIADGVFWVGYFDEDAALHCNPYLICDGDEAILIDGGNRPDFSTVMTRVLQAGVALENIRYLLYQHYDPDLCSSIPHLEYLIDSNKLKILSHRENNIFIKYYGGTAQRLCVEEMGLSFEFSSEQETPFFAYALCTFGR